MNCHATRALLDLHAEGRLNPGRAAKMEGHLRGCASCRALTAPPPPAAKPAPAALKARLLAAARADAPAPDAAPGRPLPLLPRDAGAIAFAAAALAVIALGVGWTGAPSQLYDAGDELAGSAR